jgi:hypothetical protein
LFISSKFRIVALFLHPPVTGAYGAVLLTPFEMNVWTSSAAMWLIVILTIRFVSWVESSKFDSLATSSEDKTVLSWSDSLMIIIGAVSEQGTKSVRTSLTISTLREKMQTHKEVCVENYIAYAHEYER